MTEQGNSGCARPEIKKNKAVEEGTEKITEVKKEEQSMVKVGKPAPNFTAPAYYKGQFTNVKLEDYKGKWVVLCFYPGDFTFV